MARPLARQGDVFVGTCAPCEGATVYGILIGDAKRTYDTKRRVALVGGTGIGGCGHTTRIISGSSLLRIEKKRAAFRGSRVANAIDGMVVTGSGKTFLGR
jgi:uncharacterized Zn-binding protein involved in type VI secretion